MTEDESDYNRDAYGTPLGKPFRSRDDVGFVSETTYELDVNTLRSWVSVISLAKITTNSSLPNTSKALQALESEMAFLLSKAKPAPKSTRTYGDTDGDRSALTGGHWEVKE